MADKRLFEQPLKENPNPAENERLAYGKAGVNTSNMTWSGLITWLNSRLSFLKPSSNLSDLSSTSTARTNLSVYAKSETYTQAVIDAALNALSNRLGGLTILLCGQVSAAGVAEKFSGTLSFTSTREAEGKYRINHGYTGNYIVLANSRYIPGFSPAMAKIAGIEYLANYFDVYTGDDASANDTIVIFVMIGY